MVRVCFVCLGNICRSPTAAGIMRQRVADSGLDGDIEVHSAGTAGYHIGELPDERARAEARRRGVDIDDPGQQFQGLDFDTFDLIVAMDHDNVAQLERLARTDDHHERIVLLRRYDEDAPPDAEVPDPYYGGEDGFRDVFDLIDAACRGLLDSLRTDHGLA
jgi:protein-tyrosine phosphatase